MTTSSGKVHGRRVGRFGSAPTHYQKTEWRNWHAVGLMLVLWALFWAPVLSGQMQFYVRDLTFYALPMKTFMLDRLQDGVFPLWTSYISTGMPFFAELSHQVLYPLNGVFWLTPTPVQGLSWFIVLHFLLAQVAFYALCRVLAFSVPLSLWGGLLFGYAGYTLSIGDNVNYLPAIVWAPLGLALFMMALRTGRLRYSVLAAMAVCLMLLAGDTFNPQCLAVVCVGLLAMRQCSETFRRGLAGVGVWAGWGHLGVMFGLAGLLAAVQLLPTQELLGLSVRQEPLSYEEVTIWSFPPERLIELIQPYFYGSKYPTPHFIGQFMYPKFREPWADSVYLGLIPVFFALSALLLACRTYLFWVLVAGVALLVSWGDLSPLNFERMLALFPPLNYHRYLEKLVFWVILALCVLAVGGASLWLRHAEALLERFSSKPVLIRVGWTLLWLLGGTLLCVQVPASLWIWTHALERSVEWGTHFYERGPHVLRVLGHWLTLLIPLVALPWMARGWRHRMVTVLLVVAILDVMGVHAGQVPLAKTDLLIDRPQPAALRLMRVDQPEGRLRMLYDDRITHQDVPNEPTTLARIAQAYGLPGLLRDNYEYYWNYRFLYNQQRFLFNFGILYDVAYLNGRFAPLQQRRHKRMDDLLLANRPELLPALAGVPYVVSSHHPPNTVWQEPAARLVGSAPEFNLSVYKVNSVVPRAYLAPNALYNPEPETVYKILTPEFLRYPYTQQVEIAAPTGLVPASQAEVGPSVALQDTPEPQATVVQDDHEQIRVSVRSPYAQASYLVLTEALFPGWRAWVDGQPVSIELANQRFMAVAVPPGAHQVTFRYESTRLGWGLGLSALGLLLFGLGLFWPKARMGRLDEARWP